MIIRSNVRGRRGVKKNVRRIGEMIMKREEGGEGEREESRGKWNKWEEIEKEEEKEVDK